MLSYFSETIYNSFLLAPLNSEEFCLTVSADNILVQGSALDCTLPTTDNTWVWTANGHIIRKSDSMCLKVSASEVA